MASRTEDLISAAFTHPPLRSKVGPAHVVSRVAASLLGSYAFVWGFVTLGITLGSSAGMPYDDAQTLFYMLAMPALVVCFCWAFVERRLLRVWAVLAGGGALMTAIAWWLGRSSS